ncbi:MAG: type II toxin-antitoxin system prevent-host-death family antitoxin [Chloroflexaceae bacterium]|nr:type II toxin-antitoxin system prevent-host-death family antitoxin [Chloroflexaceae bacterium]
MKIIPLTEAKARLSHYAELCQTEPVVVTVNGVPAFQLVPVDAEDDLVNQLLDHHPTFAADMQMRLMERPLPWPMPPEE